MLDKYNIPSIQDADLNGKVVLVRVDHNVVKKELFTILTGLMQPLEHYTI